MESDKIDWRNKGAQGKKTPQFQKQKKILKTCEHNGKKKEETVFLRVGSVTWWVCVMWNGSVKEVAAGDTGKSSRAFANMTQTF